VINRRKTDRKYLTYFARVTNLRTGHLMGYLVDLTSEGALLIGDMELEIGISYTLRIDLPDEIPSNRYLEIDAQVVWTKPDTEPNFFRTGLKIFPLNDVDRQRQEELLSLYSAKK
jgi:hypothetical protein